MELGQAKIGVLGGGVSGEREISLISAEAAFSALQRANLDAIFIDICTSQKEKVKKIITSYGVDIAFIGLHGKFGEDGQVQAILEELDIVYTGSDSNSSLLAMDKVLSKDKFLKTSIPTPSYWVCSDIADIPYGDIGYPVVVKPHFCGSSLGVSIVKNESDLNLAIEEAFSYGDKIIIEEYVEGREVTVGILDEVPLPVVEIIPKKGFYDFKTKYSDSDCPQYVVPAELDDKVVRQVQEVGLCAHRALGCRHFSRVDLRLGLDDTPYVLEVNSIPGLTSHSLLPLAASACGINFDQLILRMVELALYGKKAAQKI